MSSNDECTSSETSSTNQRASRNNIKDDCSMCERISVPNDFFVYVGPAEVKGNSVYRCVKCPSMNGKSISCNDRSRQNLKKHVMVSFSISLFLVTNM